MKYILLNDILSLKNNYYKHIFGYIIIIICTFIAQVITGYELCEHLFIDVVGLNSNIDDGIFAILMFVLNFGMHMLVVFRIFDNDIKNGESNIFLRLSLNRWILYKYVSILFINIILRLPIYMLLFLLFNILGSKLSMNIVLYFIINVLLILFLDLIFFNIYMFSKRSKLASFAILLAIFFLFINCCKSFDILKLNLFLLFVLIFVLALIFYILVRKRFVNILE